MARTNLTTAEIADRFGEFDAVFAQLKNDKEDFEDDIALVPEMTSAAYDEFRARRSTTPYGRAVRELHDFVVPGLLEAYVRSDPAERERILAAIASRPFALIALWSLLKDYQYRFQKAPTVLKPDLLRTLLRLAVLVEPYLDEPDTAMILSHAWHEAVHEGLDPVEYFRDAAAAAGRRPILHGRSARDFLESFEPYDFGPARTGRDNAGDRNER
jgi:hypothetical protein